MRAELVSVGIDRKTYNTLKTYLAGFWHYYESSPTLQKALENT